MIIQPNAKINIGLNITEKRTDGFHNIESVFYPVYKLTDKIDIQESSKFNIVNNGINLKINSTQNLIYKAFKVIKDKFNIPYVNINLQKDIPTGAGLGGGSADAAFMLKYLNNKYNLKLTNEDLEKIALGICSDCPFFIKNSPRFVSGKGDKFKDINLDLSNYFLVIIKPDIFISTPEAYSRIIPQKPKYDLLTSIEKPVTEWRNYIFNDFEKSIFVKNKILNDIKQYLYSEGAVFAAMSGSGSSIFGLFKEKITIKKFHNFFVWNNFM